MQRRDFFRHSTLRVAGLLTAQVVLAGSYGRASAQPTVEIAIFCQEEQADHPAIAGVLRLLRESGRSFDVVHQLTALERYTVLLLPDVVRLSSIQAAQIDTYLSRGGRLLASWQSGLTPDGSAFASHRFGLRVVGEARCSPDFVVPGPRLASHTSSHAELLMYLRGMEVEVREASLLTVAYPPAPLAGAPQPTSYPAVTLCNGVAYFAHPIFTQYAHTAPRWCGQLVLNALDHLTKTHTGIPAPTLTGGRIVV
ncbi:MAG: hypothetical protein KKG00_09675 [Bacteroidetes bacterium]|nr:hypothetical protein [Bacteroidota bacterium]